MRVAVVGAGAIGLLYGSWLQKGGADVCFVARGERLAALRGKPFDVEGEVSVHLDRLTVVERAEDAGPADVVLVTTKLYDLDEASAAAKLALSSDGVMIGVQNGVSVFDTFRKLLPAERIAVGSVYTVSKVSGPNTVSYFKNHRVVLGNPEVPVSPNVHELVSFWKNAGIEAWVTDDIPSVIWQKLAILTTNTVMTCMVRQPLGNIYPDPDLFAIAVRVLGEAVAVARAVGVHVGDDEEALMLKLLSEFPPTIISTMAQDLMAGRRLELEGLAGALVRLGAKHGVPTPIHSLVYAFLKPYRNGPPRPIA